jgi:hypothetical protein
MAMAMQQASRPSSSSSSSVYHHLQLQASTSFFCCHHVRTHIQFPDPPCIRASPRSSKKSGHVLTRSPFLSLLPKRCGIEESRVKRSSSCVGYQAFSNKTVARCLITEVSEEAGVEEAGEGGGGGGEEVASQSSKPRARGSAQLARWARARRIRSGRMPSTKMQTQAEVEAQQFSEGVAAASDGVSDGESDDEDGGVGGKCVYMVSDGTGWTAEHAVHAALGQFEHCLVDQRCSVDTHLFSQINEVERLMEIIRQAAQEEALVFFTLADPQMAEAAKQACEVSSFSLDHAHFDASSHAVGNQVNEPFGCSKV